MASKAYSFIDIAVLDPVRQRFARGEAIAILDPSLEHVIWANGPGAAFLGFADVEAAIGSTAELAGPVRRQISSLSGFPELSRAASVSVRMNRGFSSQLASLSVESLKLPDSERAVLIIALPGPSAYSSGTTAAALSGLAGEGQAAAIVDSTGQATVSTAGFDALELSPAIIDDLVRDVRTEADRLVKRRIKGVAGLYPAAIARLTDEPATHLLIVVDDPAEEKAPPAPLVANVESVQTATPASDDSIDTTAESPPAATAAQERSGRPPSPVRFVWRTDETGRFSSVSEEFAQAVGEPAADVIGRAFRDVATVFGMDHDGEVGGLLERRDTWSGRTLWWPLAGSDLHVPVDLAALPVYGRERNFEGFRGFGVARIADARPDPERIGLSLVPGAHPDILSSLPPTSDRAAEPSATEPAKEPDPFEGEVPVLETAVRAGQSADGKVVRLSERQQAGAERHLSSAERQAFREIGDRLRRDHRVEPPKSSDAQAGQAQPAREQAPPPVQAHLVPVAPASDDQPEAASPTRTEALPGRNLVEESGDADDQRDLWRLDASPESEALHGPPIVRAADALEEAPEEGRSAAPTDTSILDQLPVPVLIHSGDELHYANPEFLRLTGYGTLAELEQAGGLDQLFVEPYDDAEDRHELRMRNSAGEEFPAEALLRSAPWAGGKALMLVVRQTGEAVALGAPTVEELRQRLAEMRTIIDTATDGVILVDRDGAIRSISQPAEALFGFDSDDVKGRPLVSLFELDSQGVVRDYLDNLSLGGVATVLNDGREVVGRESEGRSVPLFMTVGRLPGDGGFCAVVRDITPWKKAESELNKARTDAEHASAQKSEFLARISHEIRTPLNAIIGFSELMMDEKFGPVSNDRYREYLRDINRSGNHVLDLVNDLLDLSKIEAGQQEMAYEAVALNDALAEAVSLMQPQANRERVIIRSSFAPRLPDIVADLRSIRQIALNILSNAVRYTQAGGQVVISTAYERNGSIVMRVRDTGVGMTQAELEQAMKPFQQINALKRPRGDGTGLGLPLTKAMVEANRARFAISSNPGEGTLVEISFPSTRVLAQ